MNPNTVMKLYTPMYGFSWWWISCRHRAVEGRRRILPVSRNVNVKDFGPVKRGMLLTVLPSC
jgi:hypothetical protein